MEGERKVMAGSILGFFQLITEPPLKAQGLSAWPTLHNFLLQAPETSTPLTLGIYGGEDCPRVLYHLL